MPTLAARAGTRLANAVDHRRVAVCRRRCRGLGGLRPGVRARQGHAPRVSVRARTMLDRRAATTAVAPRRRLATMDGARSAAPVAGPDRGRVPVVAGSR